MRRAATILLVLPLVISLSACDEKKSRTATTPNEEVAQVAQAPKTTATTVPARFQTQGGTTSRFQTTKVTFPVPGVTTQAAQEVNPIPLDKWSGKVLEDEWGLKIKAVTYKDKTWRVLVVFTKDLEGDSLTSLRQCFQPFDSRKGVVTPIYVHFFDEDMVQLTVVAPALKEGFLSGKKDDAVRFHISYPTGAVESQAMDRAKKAEFRGSVPKATK